MSRQVVNCIVCIIFTSFYRPHWIKQYGETYCPSLFLLYNWQIDDLPQFVRIKDIIVVCTFVLLEVDIYYTEGINDHLMAYMVQPLHQATIIHLSNCLSYQVFSSHKFIGDNCQYVYVRSYIEKIC